MEIFKGIAASKGIGIGNTYVIPRLKPISITKVSKSAQDIPSEWARFLHAVEQVTNEIKAVIDDNNESQSAIANSYLSMLSDTVFFEEIHNFALTQLCNIEYAAKIKTDEMIAQLEKSDDTYLKERSVDVNDVFTKVLGKLTGNIQFDLSAIPEHSIIVAKNLNPSDVMLLLKHHLLGLVLEGGGVNSHLGILARNYGIPAIFGVTDIDIKVTSGDDAIIDGVLGTLILKPNTNVLANYTKQLVLLEQENRALEKFREQKTITKDGIKIGLFANIGCLEDAQIALDESAAGIGLFRTEFLFMQSLREARANGIDDKQALSEEAQFKVYKSLLEMMGNKPVTIRTLDIGGDKVIDAAGLTLAPEKNPLLGFRAIRFCLAHKDLFRTQLRALYRASQFGNLKIMIPLITDPDQLLQVQEITENIKAGLRAEGVSINENTQLGIMVETAAAAVLADFFAEYSDFFSIGTNDLTQYTLGVDRENPSVSSLFNEFHPAVLKLIKHTIECGNKTSLQVSVCGEMASSPEGVLALLGLGVRSFSMAPKNISRIKQLLSRFTIAEVKEMMEQALQLQSASEIRSFITNFARVI